MKSVYEKKENCCGCVACKQICPTKSIKMKEDNDGYVYPIIDSNGCIDCKACIKVCPLKNIRTTNVPRITYAYVNQNQELRKKSASSGAFEALCKAFLKNENNYSIYGCELNNKLQATHCSIQNIEDISRMKKSKYIQSHIENEYNDVLNDLEAGKMVVFSGTPCQIAALNNFLKKDFDNLLTIDFVCHGVPSQKIFSKYVKYLEKKYNGKVKTYTFRNKRKVNQKWSVLGVCINFTNGKIVELEAEEDLYMTGFLLGLFNRDSCYECKFAGLNRVSDITIGDFWGVEKVYPELTETKTNGTSLIMANTSKGIDIIERLDVNTLYSADLGDAIKENRQLIQPQKKNERREIFFREFRRNKKFNVCMKRSLPEKYGFKIEKIYQMKFYVKLSKTKQFVLKKFKML